LSALELEVSPPSPFRLPAYSSEDRTMSVRDGVVSRLLRVGGSPVLVRAWEPGRGRVALRAEPVDPAALCAPRSLPQPDSRPAGAEELRMAIRRMRFALAVDDDLSELYRRFRRDPLLGPQLRRRPWLRPRRRPWAWEALAWAVVKQLIETERAARIQRRIVGRWGMRLGREGAAAPSRFGPDRGTKLYGVLRDVPDAATIAGRAPAELASMDLSPGRSIALRAVAREVAAGRCDPARAPGDRRLLAVPEIGPWTVQCLGLFGRGDPDSLPAGDLIYLKLVGRLARLGRRATVEEVEEFYAPYEPFRGLAAFWTIGLYR
jgi:3-methyladenine DNA glycosylase/8-oxoguanine DNA glycosylase